MAFKHWLSAARPRTLPLAAASALCGGLLAALQRHGNARILALCTATAVALQVFGNLANDYGDACNGADSSARRGPARMVGSGLIGKPTMRRALVLCATACCLLGITLLAEALPALRQAQYWPLWLLLGAFAVTAAYAYTAGSRPYGYIGLGDASVLLFFGWVGVLGTAYLHTGRLNAISWLPATALGLWCVMVLNLNNMRDIGSDGTAGKKTIAVCLGLYRAKAYHTALLAASVAMWWLWLPHDFSGNTAAGLKAVLAAAALAHLHFLKKAQSCQSLDKLLPQWSITVLLWIGILWLAVFFQTA